MLIKRLLLFAACVIAIPVILMPVGGDVVVVVGQGTNVAAGGGLALRDTAQSADGDFNVTASPLVTYPTVSANDILITIFRSVDAHDASGTAPTGWTKIGESDGPGGTTSIYWKRASGSETTETWTDIFAATESGIALTISISGAITSGDALSGTPVVETSTSSTAKDISGTTAHNNALVIGTVGFDNTTASPFTLAVDAGDEWFSDTTTPNGYSDARNCQAVVNAILVPVAGAQNVGLDLGTATSAEEIWFALRPQ